MVDEKEKKNHIKLIIFNKAILQDFLLIVMSDNNFQNDLDNLSDNSQKSSRKRVKLNDQSIQSNQQMIEDIKHLASVGSQITAYLEMPTKKVQEYVKKTKKEILIDEVLLDKFLPPNSITPIIFTRKLPTGGQYRVKQNQAPWVTAFENILTCVVQLYYKSDHKISEFMRDKLSEPKKEIKPARPGRKKKQNVDDQTDLLEIPQNGSSYNQLQQDILEILVSPLRNDLPFETWTIKEIAIFECGLCRFGKQYEYISQLMKTKTAQDIVQFYYFWKFTSHYRLWKMNKAYYHRSNLNNYV